ANVTAVNYLGDWGKQFGLIAAGFELFGNKEKINDIQHLVEVYIKAAAKAKEEPDFNLAANIAFKNMEDGVPEAIELWQILKNVSIEEFKKVYERLSVSFDVWEGESDYSKTEDIILKLKNLNVIIEDDGCLLVNASDEHSKILVQKSDGTSIYISR